MYQKYIILPIKQKAFLKGMEIGYREKQGEAEKCRPSSRCASSVSRPNNRNDPIGLPHNGLAPPKTVISPEEVIFLRSRGKGSLKRSGETESFIDEV